MATRKRPVSHKREREFRKRLRERQKAEKATLKRERRAQRSETEAEETPGSGVNRDDRADGDSAAQQQTTD